MDTITIERLGHLGDGVSTVGGAPVHVPGALPGEVVAGEIVEGRMAAPRVVTPTADRVKAPCPHFGQCGGCVMQHASDALVADWRRQVVETALTAQGLHAPISHIATSPERSRRRATFAGKRTKKGVTVGFHARAAHQVVEVPECRVVHPDLLALRPLLEALTRLGASRKGILRLSVTLSEAGPDVAVDEAKSLEPAQLVELTGLIHTHNVARLSWNGEVIATPAPPRQRMGRGHVIPPPGAFLQATPEGEAALVAEVRRIVGAAPRVVDLFAGCGTFALPLAEAAEVHAVESAADMLAALDRAWRETPGLKRVTTKARDLFRRPLLPSELKDYDAAVIDPPRAGAQAQVAEIAASGLACLAHVSCNPVTFARDAKLLVEHGFRLGPVTIVDQFRWSSHLELVAGFTR